MTHDELIKEINELDDSCSVSHRLAVALLEVAKLHEPVPDYIVDVVCDECSNALTRFEYPCKTIIAIERGLSE